MCRQCSYEEVTTYTVECAPPYCVKCPPPYCCRVVSPYCCREVVLLRDPAEEVAIWNNEVDAVSRKLDTQLARLVGSSKSETRSHGCSISSPSNRMCCCTPCYTCYTPCYTKAIHQPSRHHSSRRRFSDSEPKNQVDTSSKSRNGQPAGIEQDVENDSSDKTARPTHAKKEKTSCSCAEKAARSINRRNPNRDVVESSQPLPEAKTAGDKSRRHRRCRCKNVCINVNVPRPMNCSDVHDTSEENRWREGHRKDFITRKVAGIPMETTYRDDYRPPMV